MPILYVAQTNILWVELLPYKKKTLRTINFQSKDSHSSPLFKSSYILKLQDKIVIENIPFINKSFNNLIPPIFNLLLTRYLNHHIRLILMEKNSIAIAAINSWKIKLNIISVICYLKNIAQSKFKIYFLKNALENMNEEAKSGNFNWTKQI